MPQIQEPQKTLSRIYTKNTTLRFIIFKLQKNKDKGKILKEVGGKKQLTYRGV